MKIEGNAVNVKTDEVRYKGWNVVKKIGTGSFGSVYEIEREDFGYLYKAALKVISIPKSEQDLEAIKNNIGKSEKSLEVYYESVASDIVKEFELMYKLRGTTNIVSYEDHEVRKHTDSVGWDIFIRMELLKPLDNYVRDHQMSRKDVILLGIDICKALERCRVADIIHRDIKPGNIFVSEQGDFKLGDFGIARTLEEHNEALELSRKGTISYMAPEIFKGEEYGFNVDLYSLGIVMYKLLNHNLLPFMPQPPAKPTYKEVTNANQMRLSGKEIPYPSEDNTQLAEIVLKAINYNPKERYQSPREMREHLEKVLRDEWIEEFDEKTVLLSEQENIKRRKVIPKQGKIAFAAVFVLCVIIIGGISSYKAQENEKIVTEETDESGNIISDTESAKKSLQDLIDEHDFVKAYTMLLEKTQNGENVDQEIISFVHACEVEAEHKRAVAAMKMLSDNVDENEAFYRETVTWFCEHAKTDYARQILENLRSKGEEGEQLANMISAEIDKN